MKSLVIGGSNSHHLAKRVASRLRLPYSELFADNFPDGELRIRFEEGLSKKRVIIVNSMMPNPNNSLIELVFAVNTAKELGAGRVVVVAPYLAYMRQDKRFHQGECVSARIMAKLLNSADQVIAVDPHLHRIKSLKEIFSTKAISITADPVLAQYIHKNHPESIIIGPDEESSQWARTIADSINHEAMILSKKRWSATKIRTIIHGDGKKFINRDVVIVDDIISTGHTMFDPIRQLKKFRAKRITCICVHGVFTLNALHVLRKLGVRVISTNTVQNSVAKIDVSPLIAKALSNTF